VNEGEKGKVKQGRLCDRTSPGVPVDPGRTICNRVRVVSFRNILPHFDNGGMANREEDEQVASCQEAAGGYEKVQYAGGPKCPMRRRQCR
jgi:hypothetical protein